jgi:hypothetical protein
MTLAPSARAAGTLFCVIHDRAVHLSLSATFDYGVSDSLTSVEGSAEIQWDGTPAALSKFAITRDMIHRVMIGRDELILELRTTGGGTDRLVEAAFTIVGKRVATDRTTVRSTYRLDLGRVRSEVATPAQSKGALRSKPLYSAQGYAECSAT